MDGWHIVLDGGKVKSPLQRNDAQEKLQQEYIYSIKKRNKFKSKVSKVFSGRIKRVPRRKEWWKEDEEENTEI